MAYCGVYGAFDAFLEMSAAHYGTTRVSHNCSETDRGTRRGQLAEGPRQPHGARGWGSGENAI